jgi:hypothetical protein
MKIWPMAFSKENEIWASNDTFHLHGSWWDLSENVTEPTNKKALIELGIYRVVGIVKDSSIIYCFARNQEDGLLYYKNKGSHDDWRKTTWTEKSIIKGSIFTPPDGTFEERKLDIEPIIVKPVVAKNPDWHKMSDGKCYYCGTRNCDHLRAL